MRGEAGLWGCRWYRPQLLSNKDYCENNLRRLCSARVYVFCCSVIFFIRSLPYLLHPELLTFYETFAEFSVYSDFEPDDCSRNTCCIKKLSGVSDVQFIHQLIRNCRMLVFATFSLHVCCLLEFQPCKSVCRSVDPQVRTIAPYTLT